MSDVAQADDLRALGWSVAVHNDYSLGGQRYTFWLVTKGPYCIKGEGNTDAEALNHIRAHLPSMDVLIAKRAPLNLDAETHIAALEDALAETRRKLAQADAAVSALVDHITVNEGITDWPKTGVIAAALARHRAQQSPPGEGGTE